MFEVRHATNSELVQTVRLVRRTSADFVKVLGPSILMKLLGVSLLGDRCVNFDVNSTSSHLLHLLSSSSMKGVEAKKRWQQLQSSKVLPERTPLPSTLSTAASLVSREEARCSMKDSDVLEDDYHLQPYHEARANFFNGTLSAPSPRLEKSVVLMGSPCLRFTQVPNSPQPESKGNTGRTELSHYDSNTHRFERLRIEEEPPTQVRMSLHPKKCLLCCC